MKIFKHLVVAAAATLLLSSCSVIKSVAASAVSSGNSTGSALATLYSIFKSTGTIDLSNATNIVNLGKILTGASSLSDATESYTDKFVSGLISGSSNLINDTNVSKVLSGLKTLSNVDASAITAAAKSAAAGVATQVTSSTEGVSETISSLKSIFNALK